MSPVIIGALLLAACGNDSTLAVAGNAIVNAAFPKHLPEISRNSVSKLPYAMITARVGKGKPAILVLGHSRGGSQQWMATNSVSVTTRHGRVERTVGFPYEVRRMNLVGDDPLASAPHRNNSTAVYRKSVELEGAQSESTLLTCTLSSGGPETITIIEIDFKTVRLEEVCLPAENKPFAAPLKSTYWVDIYDGFVWQSEQQWHKDQPTLTLSVLKPEKVQ